MATLVATFGGQPTIAPALREVPLESNTQALRFAAALVDGEFDLTIFLTGVGTRALVSAVDASYPRETLAAALGRTRVVARGPKPVAVLRELGVPIWALAPEPNTWREVIAAIEAKADEYGLAGARVAVRSTGVANLDLLEGLRTRGAVVTSVPVYRWALPDDLRPLEDAVAAIARGDVDVMLFTTGVQVVHLWQVVQRMGLEEDVRRGLARAVIASIGPTTSEELRHHGLSPDIEASHSKIGFLVREAAENQARILAVKRGGRL